MISRHSTADSPLRLGRCFAVAVAGAAVVVVALAACGGTTKSSTQNASQGPAAQGSANPNRQIKSGLKIAFLPKQVNNPYFTISDNGGKKAVDAVGGVYKEVPPTRPTPPARCPM